MGEGGVVLVNGGRGEWCWVWGKGGGVLGKGEGGVVLVKGEGGEGCWVWGKGGVVLGKGEGGSGVG